jgi:hypothetical protein
VALLDVVVTTGAGALSATVGVVVGSLLTRHAEQRQWLLDRQLAAYADLLGHYARFTMTISRAHADRSGWDYDWGAWSASLVAASLVAPGRVAREIDAFGAAVGGFLTATGAYDSTTNPLTPEEFRAANARVQPAQARLVNAIRRSLGDRDDLGFTLGGTLGRPAEGA